MKKIKKLEYYCDKTSWYKFTYTPTNDEIMDKVNEIIDVVNKLMPHEKNKSKKGN